MEPCVVYQITDSDNITEDNCFKVTNANTIGLNVYDNTNTDADSLMTREFLEIRIYN